ncbi:hypothetical protein ZWY2020_051174 [Hordeum vulgare]|nr:hypothetical protein ZWY2020_051174 [Hordeum vulgare]
MMPSWKYGQESNKEEELTGMDMEHWENQDTIVNASFYGRASDPSIKCRLHLAPCLKYVAFEGINIGRRFYTSMTGGIDCGVAEWVDAPWPSVLQRCLVKIWEMFHEVNCGRVMVHKNHKKEVAKLNKQLFVDDQYNQLVQDVINMFDWAYQNNRLITDEESYSHRPMMPSWKYGQESSKEEELTSMDMEQWGGIDCGVAEWVDAPWPSVLQRCLVKIWEMFHEVNCGRVMDHKNHKKEVAKLNKQLLKLMISTTS